MDDIAQRIQARMEALGLSARSLSLKAGLSERHVGKILERGSGGGAEGNTLVKIASALGVSVAWLMTGAEDPQEIQVVPDGEAAPTQGARPGADDVVAEVLETSDVPEVYVRMVLNSGSMQSLNIPLTPAALEAMAKVVQRHAERRRR